MAETEKKASNSKYGPACQIARVSIPIITTKTFLSAIHLKALIELFFREGGGLIVVSVE